MLLVAPSTVAALLGPAWISGRADATSAAVAGQPQAAGTASRTAKANLAEPASTAFPCSNPGWFPVGFDLKEHTIFQHDGLYYIAATYLETDGYEKSFAYASSPDLCEWTDLGRILTERIPGTRDEFRIWSPHVYQEDGVYYLFYTGVTGVEDQLPWAQSTMLATSENPSDPDSWVPRGMVFQPSHPGMIWWGFVDRWSNCRDPMVTNIDDLYYMYYTGLDESGGIIGLATANSPYGAWIDSGAIFTSTTSMPENATVTLHDAEYYLFYNDSQPPGLGQVYRHGPTIRGPWSDGTLFRPGWGHEVWRGTYGELYTSFLMSGDIHIRRVSWSDYRTPAAPFIGAPLHRIFLPLTAH